MKGYTSYSEVTRDILDSIETGDLVKVNDWNKPMRVAGVSDSYIAMFQKIFKRTYYSIIEKKPRKYGNHNEMKTGMFHCGPDDWIFGDSEFEYDFSNQEAVNRYLMKFEEGKCRISERNGVNIRSIEIKKIAS